MAPDLDGLSLLFGREAYRTYHHQLTHNLLFSFVLAGLSARWIGRRPLQLARVWFCVLVHYLGDYYGSGPGWGLALFRPFSGYQVLNRSAWPFNGWQSQTIFLLSAFATVWIARRFERTPLEAVFPGMNRMFSDLAVLGFATRCDCGRRAIYRCHECRIPRCSAHVKLLPRAKVICAACFDGPALSGAEQVRGPG